MKKFVSAIFSLIFCASICLCLNGCGDNGSISKKDFKAISDSPDGMVNLDESAISEFETDEDIDGLKIYTYEKDSKKSSYLVKDGKASTLAYLVEDVALFDVDGDGVKELFSCGSYHNSGADYIVLEISYYGENVFYENLGEGYHSWALDYFPADDTYGFVTDENGVKFVSYTKSSDRTQSIKKDFGYATPNGPIINLSNAKNLTDPTDSPDMSIFCTSEKVCTLDGKEFKPAEDFVAVINPFIANHCINVEELKEYTGFDIKEGDSPVAAKSIATIYGKKYVADIAIQLFSDGNCNPFGNDGTLKFMSPGYSEN